MVLRRRKRADDEIVKVNGGDGSTYEELRQRRINENKERMQKLGISDLSLNLKSLTAPTPKTKTSQNVKLPKSSLPLSTSTRRSSRLRSVNPVDYSVSDFYTAIYDPEKGEQCHQCRHTTVRLHTRCSCCKARQGQFCERCLRMRYGENVIKVNKDANWVCPVCRGICNCSSCRKAKGLAPVGFGPIYGKVLKLGFKSVAHYLIHTQQVKTQPEDTGVEISESEERDTSFSNKAMMEEEEKMCCSDAMKCVDDTDAFNEKKTREVRTQPEDTGVEISEAEERDLSFSNKARVEEEEEKVCCSDSTKCVDDTYAFDENKTLEVSEMNL